MLILPKVNKTNQSNLVKKIKKIVAGVLAAATLVGTAVASQVPEVTESGVEQVSVAPMLLTQTVGSPLTWHSSHSSHASHMSHRSHMSHMSHYSGRY